MTDTVVDLIESIDTLNKGIETLLEYNETLRRENDSLRNKEARANELFGVALVQAAVQRTGPSRPNRPKLTEIEVRDIRQAYQGGMRQKDLARNYGVNPATISRTVRGFYN